MAANTEIVVRKEGVIKWKSDLTGATAQTVGYALGGITVSITRYRQEVRNNDGSFAHWKTTKDPEVDIKVSKLYQDSASDMLQAGIVLTTTVTAGGSGYTSAPTVTFSAPQMPGGVTATGTATITGNAVTAITITNPGSGYTSAPTISFSGGAGAGATATATVSPIGFLAAVSGQTTPSGKLSIEMTKADGTLDIIRVSKAAIVSNNKNQADGGDTHELSFKAIGEPDYTQTATLT